MGFGPDSQQACCQCKPTYKTGILHMAAIACEETKLPPGNKGWLYDATIGHCIHYIVYEYVLLPYRYPGMNPFLAKDIAHISWQKGTLLVKDIREKSLLLMTISG